MNQDPLAAIATPEAVAAWLQTCGLGDLAEDFHARGWHGDALLDANEADLEAVVGPDRMGLVRYLLEPLRKLRAANATSPRETPDETTVHLSEAGNRDLVEFCEQLAASPDEPWVEAVMAEWPGPVAHEYFRLRELLAEGQIIGAIWQLKDVAEVLIRFPALVMARDVLAHSPAPELPRAVRRQLLGPPLTMGSWLELAATTLAKPIRQSPERFAFPAVAGLFRQTPTGAKSDPKITALAKQLSALTSWRNEAFGHGAFQLDLRGFQQELGAQIAALNRTLAPHAECWRGLELRIGAPDGALLHGAASIRERHDRSAPGHHENRIEPLWLIGDGRQLLLAPYLTLRRCTRCSKQDVFLYDWRRLGKQGRDKYGFIDFLAGHAMAWPWHRDPELHRETKDLAAPRTAHDADGQVVQDYARREVTALLTERALDADYQSPRYLRAALAAFIEQQDRGVFWLQAPAHVGKSVFVRGLDAQTIDELTEQPLREDLVVGAFYIRREYQCFPAQFKDRLQLQLREALGIDPQRSDLPQLNLEADDPPAAFVDWLGRLFAIGRTLDRKLLVCIDGLDELRKPEQQERSILDFIPAARALPPDVYLLLTSRPETKDECPRWVRERLAERFAAAGAVYRHTIELDDTGYEALLRQYFDTKLRARLEEAASQRMRRVLTGEQAPGDAPATRLPDSLKNSFEAEWQRLKKELAVSDSRLTAAPLPVNALGEVVTGFDRLFEQVLAKSERRFLYVGYLTDLLADATLALDSVDQLPSAEQLFEHYLRELQRVQSDKQNDPLKEVILHLAAAEEAYWWDAEYQPPVALEETWRGLPLDVLSELVEGRDGENISVRLVYTLYSLKALLGSWKGDEAAHARFRLGLKGMAETVSRLWSADLKALHGRLAGQLLAQLDNANNVEQDDELADQALEAAGEYLLRYVIAHTALSEDKTLAETVDARSIDLSRYFGTRHDQAKVKLDYRTAIQWATVLLIQWDVLRDPSLTPLTAEQQNYLVAMVYMSRGAARAGQGDPDGAIADFGRAIDLREALRQALGAQWPPDYQNDLAEVYMDRGNARADQGDPDGAIADHGRAIELREALRQALGAQWPPGYQNDLAGVYTNRGAARAGQGDPDGAIADYGRAIELREALRQALGAQWPPGYQNDLAAVYRNRGAARAGQGDPDGEITDYGRAIELREALRQALGAQWRPRYQNDLAGVHINRGNARAGQGDPDGAIADYGQAVELGEQLLFVRQHLPVIPNLAITHYNRVLMSQQNDPLVVIQPSPADEALRFLDKFVQLLDPGQLPEEWQRKLSALSELLIDKSRHAANRDSFNPEKIPLTTRIGAFFQRLMGKSR